MRKRVKLFELINEKYKEHKFLEYEEFIFGKFKVVNGLKWLKSFWHQSLFEGLWRYFVLLEGDLFIKIFSNELTHINYEKEILKRLLDENILNYYCKWLENMLDIQLQRLKKFEKEWGETYDIGYDNNPFNIIKLSYDGNAMYKNLIIIDGKREIIKRNNKIIKLSTDNKVIVKVKAENINLKNDILTLESKCENIRKQRGTINQYFSEWESEIMNIPKGQRKTTIHI
ncbi:MAG: hypothetical protein NTU73_11205 [Ignavibacteriae bacterium]|nr:hypothetical protein [Ignavibacteriota bacterium]